MPSPQRRQFLRLCGALLALSLVLLHFSSPTARSHDDGATALAAAPEPNSKIFEESDAAYGNALSLLAAAADDPSTSVLRQEIPGVYERERMTAPVASLLREGMPRWFLELFIYPSPHGADARDGGDDGDDRDASAGSSRSSLPLRRS
jgi:hypothetical protein